MLKERSEICTLPQKKKGEDKNMVKKWKRKAIACLTVLAMVGTMLPQNPFGLEWSRTALADSLPTPVFLYTFEESDVAKRGDIVTIDSVGSCSNGATIVGAGTIKNDDGGYFDNATELHAIHCREDYLILPTGVGSMLYKNKGVSTISMWVKAPEGTSQDKDYGFFSPLFAAKHNVALKDKEGEDAKDVSWPFYNIGLRGTQQVNCDGYFDNNEKMETSYLQDNEWHLVTAVCGDGTSTVYIDGNTVNTKETEAIFTNAFGENLDTVSVGGNNIWTWDDPDAHLYFDDVAVYDQVLTASQVTELYKAGRKASKTTQVKVPKELAQYDFEDTTGITIGDAQIKTVNSNQVLHIDREANGTKAVIASPFANKASLDGFTFSIDVFNLECNTHENFNSLDGILQFIGDSQEFDIVSTPGVYKVDYDNSGTYKTFDYNQYLNKILEYEKEKWYTITVVINPNGIEIYKNGVRMKVVATAGTFVWDNFKSTVTASDANITFGNSKFWGSETAYLDNLRFYDSALTPKEVRVAASKKLELLELNLTEKAKSDISVKDDVYTITTNLTDYITKNGSNYDIDLSSLFSSAKIKSTCYDDETSITADYNQLTTTGTVTNVSPDTEIPVTFQYGSASITKKILIKSYTCPLTISAENVNVTDLAGNKITSTEINHGEDFLFKAEAEQGYTIETVSYTMGSGTATEIKADADGSYTIPNVQDSLTITVKAVLNSYPIKYIVDDEEITDEKLETEYTIETTKIILPNLTKEGYDFDGWYTSDSYTDKISAYTVQAADYKDAGLTFYAKWSVKKYTVSISGASADGSVVVLAGKDEIKDKESIDFNEIVKVTVTPAAGKEIETFTVKTASDDIKTESIYNETDKSTTYTFKMPAEDIEITVAFAEEKAHTITISDTNKADIKVNQGTGYAGDKITFSVTPKAEYIGDYALTVKASAGSNEITLIPVTENTVNGTLIYTFTLLSQDIVIEEAFTYLALDAEERPDIQEASAKVDYEKELLVKNGDNLEIAEQIQNPEWTDFTADISLNDLPDIVYVRTKGSLTGGIYTPASKYTKIDIWRTPIVTVEASAVYGKTLSEIVISGSAIYEGQKVEGSFTWEAQEASTIKPKAGTTEEYTAVFTPKENVYKTVKGIKVTLVVEKAIPVYTIPTGLTAVEGTTLGAIKLTEGFAFKNPEESVGEVGTKKFPAVFTPSDSDNYKTVSDIEIEVTVTAKGTEGPQDPTPVIPTKPVIPEGYNYLFDFKDDITKNGASPVTKGATGKVEIVEDTERGKVLHITDEGTELFGQNYYKLPEDIFKGVTDETGATIAMWVKIPSAIIDENSVLFNSTPEKYSEWNLWKINANLITNVNAGNPQAWGDSEASEVTKDAWHQVTSTLTKESLNVYLDGKLVAEVAPNTAAANTYTGPLEQIAKNKFNVLGAGGFPIDPLPRDISDCYYDDIIIYPTALTAEQIQKLYAGSPEENPTDAVPVTGIALNKKEITLEVGGSETLTATITPENATNKEVTWASDDTGIATVDGNGKVTAIAAGNTVIKATAVSDAAITTSCAVTVKKAAGNTTTPSGSTSSGSSSSNTPTTPSTDPSDNNTDNKEPEKNPSTTTTTKPDGTVVETSKETAADGTVKETVKETAADGAVKETVKETAKDGTVKETVKEATADNSVTKEKVTETKADGKVTMEATVTDQKNAAVFNAVVEKDASGKVTKANAVISAGAADLTVAGKKASVTVNVSDVIMNAAAESDGIDSVVIEITKPVLSSAYANKNVTNGVTVNVTIDTVDKVAISGIVLTSESIAEAKAAGQKLTVNVITNNADKADYKVVIPAKQLKKITDTTKPIDIMVNTISASKLAGDSSKGKVSTDVKNVLTNSKAKQNKTYVLSVAENKDLKAGMKITANVNKDTAISPNQTVYVYKYNEKTGKFVEVANSKQKVSANGTVSIDAKSGTDYVVSSKKLSGSQVTTIKSQIKASVDKSSVKAGKSIAINVDLPATLKAVKSFGGSSTFGKEQAIVLYESSDNKVAAVTAKGTVKAKKAGKATITVTVGTEGGQTKKIKKTITVK